MSTSIYHNDIMIYSINNKVIPAYCVGLEAEFNNCLPHMCSAPSTNIKTRHGICRPHMYRARNLCHAIWETCKQEYRYVI